jgi:hypothetical protein
MPAEIDSSERDQKGVAVLFRVALSLSPNFIDFVVVELFPTSSVADSP